MHELTPFTPFITCLLVAVIYGLTYNRQRLYTGSLVACSVLILVQNVVYDFELGAIAACLTLTYGLYLAVNHTEWRAPRQHREDHPSG